MATNTIVDLWGASVETPPAWAMRTIESGRLKGKTDINPSACARNRGMTIIDYIEAEGQIDILESVAMEIFQ